MPAPSLLRMIRYLAQMKSKCCLGMFPSCMHTFHVTFTSKGKSFCSWVIYGGILQRPFVLNEHLDGG